MHMPSIRMYAKGENAVQVVLPCNGNTAVLWFSYSTLIAFQIGNNNRVVMENRWSTTTGKHLNAIDSGGTTAKKNRVDVTTFTRLYNEQTLGLPLLQP